MNKSQEPPGSRVVFRAWAGTHQAYQVGDASLPFLKTLYSGKASPASLHPAVPTSGPPAAASLQPARPGGSPGSRSTCRGDRGAPEAQGAVPTREPRVHTAAVPCPLSPRGLPSPQRPIPILGTHVGILSSGEKTRRPLRAAACSGRWLLVGHPYSPVRDKHQLKVPGPSGSGFTR